MFSLAGTLLGFYQLKTLIEGSKGRTHVLSNDLTSVANTLSRQSVLLLNPNFKSLRSRRSWNRLQPQLVQPES